MTDNSLKSESSVLELSKLNNLAAKGFFIKNGTISIESKSFNGSFNFYAKVNRAGDFIVSCKGPFDIELMRIYGTSDSVFVIDRINRVIYCGAKRELLIKYGLPETFWNFLVGDIPEKAYLDGTSSPDEVLLNAVYSDENYKSETVVSKKTLKAEKTKVSERGRSGKVDFVYSNLNTGDGYIFPGLVVIDSETLLFHVEITVESMKIIVDEPINVKLPMYKSIGI